MRTCKLFAGLAMAGILTGGSAFGQGIIVEDFNSGVFTSATTSRATVTNAEGTTVYNWAGTAAGDSFDGWIPLIDTSGGEQAAGTEIRLDGQFNAFGPQGSNSMAGWGTADGNLSSLYAAQNDVPKSGWQKTVQLDAGMGGARNAAGDALAFVLIYDAELAYIHQRGAVGRANAVVILDGESHTAHSPLFYRESISFDDTRDPPRWLAGDPWSFNFTPSAEDLNVENLPVEALLNTDDSISGVDLAAGGAAHRGVSSGVIEQVVPNGSDITVRFLHNRFNQRTSSPRSNWQWMNVAVDNVKLVALEAGDVNGDLNVTSSDIAAIIQAGTFNTGVPAIWSTGDFTGDGVVTSADIAAIIQAGQFNAGPYAALNTDNSNLVDPVGELPYLEIDLDGSAVMTTNMVGNQGFQIISPAGTLTGTADVPAGVFLTNSAEEASILFQQVPDVLDLGMLVADLDAFIADLAAGNVTFRVANAEATGFVEGNVFVVPEPASLALLGLGGLALLRRRSA